MRSNIHWINHPRRYRLGIMARPRSGDWLADEIDLWRADGLDVVISLLEPEEVEWLELRDEAEHCRSSGIEFISFPIADRGIPDPRDARVVASSICKMLGEGKTVAIHCRAGIGRSALMAGAVLVLANMSASDAFDAIGRARGLSVPDTEEQRQWLADFAEDIEDLAP